MPTSSGLAPSITSTGVSAGTFTQWQSWLIGQYQSIFGADAYLGDDSQDGQYIGVLAQALSDVSAAVIAGYNSFSPVTAQGAGLSSNVKINGLTRNIPTFSTVIVRVTGNAGTAINNGQVKDTSGVIWNLPTLVTIPNAGYVDVQATSSIAGAVPSPIGTLTTINTPVYGWYVVNNYSPGALGSAVETDAALRVRQAQSVALPSQTIFDGILAGIEAVNGVTRVKGYENNTGTADANSIPAKTLYFVVENGDPVAIASAIGLKITPGVPLLGSVVQTYVSPAGSTKTIRFDRPTYLPITISMTIKALSGWQPAFEAQISAALVAYLNTIQGGDVVSFLALPGVALLPGTPAAGTFHITNMTIAATGHAAASADIALAYNQMALGDTTLITYLVT